MKHHDEAFAAALEGDERRAVGKPRPGALGKPRIGLGENLARHRHVLRDRQAEEGARLVEGREALGLLPGHGAAEHAPVAAKPHGRQAVGIVGQTRAGEAQQHAALLDEIRKAFIGLARRDLGVREDEHVGALVQRRERRVFVRAGRKGDLREGRERALEIMRRREQRLRAIDGAAGDDGDAAHALARVEQRHGARRGFIRDAQQADLVS